MTCPSCGEQVQPADHFCLNCGHPLRLADPTQTLTMPPPPSFGDGPPYYGDTPPSYGDTPPSYGDASAGYGDAAPTYGTAPAAPPPAYTPQTAPPPSYADQPPAPSYANQSPPAYAPRPTQTQTRGGQGQWASGSSFPSANPYNSQPTSVTPGTMVNGRPAGGSGGGLLKGLGAGVVAILLALKAFGHALAGIGFFKLYFLLSFLRWFSHDSLGTIVLIVVIVLIVGAVLRSRTA